MCLKQNKKGCPKNAEHIIRLYVIRWYVFKKQNIDLKTQPGRNADNSFVRKQQTGLLISRVRGEATINNDLQMVCHQIHALTRR